MSTRKVYGFFFFRGNTVTGTSYLEMRQTWLFPKLQDDEQEYLIMLWLACWLLVPNIAGSNPAEAVAFFWRKNPQHVLLRRVSKAFCPMSQVSGMLKNPVIYVEFGIPVQIYRPFFARNSVLH
jgi:hypothetical protein